MRASTDDGFHVRDAGAMFLAAFYRENVEYFEEERLPLGNLRESTNLVEFYTQRVAFERSGPKRDGRLTALQVLCNQSAAFGQEAFRAFRTLFLLDLESLDGSSQASYLDPVFQKTYECTTREYVTIMWALWFLSLTATGLLDGAGLARNSAAASRLAPLTDRVLREQSCRAQDIQAIIDGPLAGVGLEGMVPEFFARYPFVEFKPGTFLAAPHPYVRMSAITGTWFRALELALRAEQQEREDHRGDTDATQRMGSRFEELAHWLLCRVVPVEHLISEHEYLRKENALSADFLVFEEDGRAVTVVQAKLKRLHPHAFYGHDFEAFVRDASGAYADSIWKSIRYLYRIHSPNWEDRLSEAGRKTAERVRKAEKIYLLGLAAAMPSVFHVDSFRAPVEAALQARLKPEEFDWYRANQDRFRGWHIVDSEELATFVMWRDRERLSDTLDTYLSLPDFGTWMGPDRSLLVSFGEYVASHGRIARRSPSLPEVDACIDRFNDWTTKLLALQR